MKLWWKGVWGYWVMRQMNMGVLQRDVMDYFITYLPIIIGCVRSTDTIRKSSAFENFALFEHPMCFLVEWRPSWAEAPVKRRWNTLTSNSLSPSFVQDLTSFNFPLLSSPSMNSSSSPSSPCWRSRRPTNDTVIRYSVVPSWWWASCGRHLDFGKRLDSARAMHALKWFAD